MSNYRYFKVIDIKSGELIEGRYAKLPDEHYGPCQNVIWLEFEMTPGSYFSYSTVGHTVEFNADCILNYKGVRFKASVRNGCVHLMDSRIEWLLKQK